MTTEQLGPGGAFHDLQVHLTKQSSVGSFLLWNRVLGSQPRSVGTGL